MAVRLLKAQGMEASEASTLAEARTLVAATHYDLVVAHLNLTDGTGAELAAELGRDQPETATILISGSTVENVAQDALVDGVDDYLRQPFSGEELSVSISRALRRRLERTGSGQAQQAAYGKEADPPQQRLAEEVFECLTRAGRFRDEETAEHVERVGRSCALIAEELGLSAHECRNLRVASAMHDIGKIGVADGVLRKPARLDATERTIIERHADIGHQILSGSTNPVLNLAATIARTHHERVDGEGYPRGLDAAHIPLAGRITAVADVFDALTHDRVYRDALTVGAALELMEEGDGSQFDAGILAAFRAVLPKIEQVRELYPDSIDPPVYAEAEVEDNPLRVLVVEDHAAVARGLSLILQREGMEIAGMAATLAEGERLIARRDADVLVLDTDLEGENGLQLIPAARARDMRVLLYTGGAGGEPGPPERVPDGVASKTGGPTELIRAIRDVAGGGSPTDSRVRPEAGPPSVPLLTPREREITTLLAQGQNGEDIATQLFLSHHTVRTHVRNAMNRAEAKTRPHLIALALEAGEITFADSTT